MPGAKRRFDRGPNTITVLNRHNRHTKEGWWDVYRPPTERPERFYDGEKRFMAKYAEPINSPYRGGGHR